MSGMSEARGLERTPDLSGVARPVKSPVVSSDERTIASSCQDSRSLSLPTNLDA